MPSTATLNDVAQAAGVTHITVSRAFSGKGAVAIATRERIFKAAKRVGYRPNTAARAMRSGRTGFIGMIRSPLIQHAVHTPQFDAGLDEELNEKGLCLVRDIIDESSLAENDASKAKPSLPRIVSENAVDGLLINYAFGTPPAVREALDRFGVPAIWINRKRSENCVYHNDLGAAIEATSELVSHGHRNIAYIREPSHAASSASGETHYSAGDREDGFARTMRAAGLAARVEDMPMNPTDDASKIDHLLQAYITYLRSPDRPTAVLCQRGGRVMRMAAAVCGLSVPGDLSIMTFDEDAPADQDIAVDRLLTRGRAMGGAAVHEVCALIEGGEPSRTAVAIPLEFHRVGTVGVPSSP
ncbi:MAG: LacI family DNA-binding transcriptional regulator [Planctomycetota bacterium]